MILTNIKEYCAEVKNRIKLEVENEFAEKVPSLAVIQLGNREESIRYVRNKGKDCEAVGIKFEWYMFDTELTTEDLIFEIENLQDHVDGLIVQMPLPKHIDVEKIKRAIDPKKDVDGFHPESLFQPCTPLGIVNYLEKACNYDFCGKAVTIFGRSDIVGKPLAQILTDRDATVTLCHSKTVDKWKHINTADLIVTAVGKERFLNCYSIDKPVIDVGINFNADGKMVGDCVNGENRDVTPVPGGVGLLTRVALLENVIAAARMRSAEALA